MPSSGIWLSDTPILTKGTPIVLTAQGTVTPTARDELPIGYVVNTHPDGTIEIPGSYVVIQMSRSFTVVSFGSNQLRRTYPDWGEFMAHLFDYGEIRDDGIWRTCEPTPIVL